MPTADDTIRLEDACAELQKRFENTPHVYFYVGFFAVIGRVEGFDNITIIFDKGDKTWVCQTVVLKQNIAQHGHSPTEALRGMLVRAREHLEVATQSLAGLMEVVS